MKIISVFFVCCLAVAFANAASEQDRKRETALKECQGDLKLSDEEAKDPKHEGCLLACMHKKVGYLNADGTLNIEITTGGSHDQLLIKKVQEVYQTCVEKAKGDSCALSNCLEKTKLP